MSGHDWDSYQYLEENGLLDDVEKVSWDSGRTSCRLVTSGSLTRSDAYFTVHPQLQFISHIPQTIKGEQLVAQLFRTIPEGSWLFKYGRVPMSLILGEWLWKVRVSIGCCRPA